MADKHQILDNSGRILVQKRIMSDYPFMKKEDCFEVLINKH